MLSYYVLYPGGSLISHGIVMTFSLFWVGFSTLALREAQSVHIFCPPIPLLTGLTVYSADVKYSGLGLHQARGDAISLEQWAKFLYGLSFIYVICVLFPRLAILSLYFALFSIHRWSSIICYATGIIMIGNCLACISALFAICRPMNALWNGGIAEHCFSINDLFRYGRIVNIITDVVLLVLPLIHVYRLQMKTRMKLGVLATFILGSMLVVLSPFLSC